MKELLLNALQEKESVRFNTLEEALCVYDKNQIFEAWVDYEGLGGSTNEFLKAMINKDISALYNIVNKEDTATLEKYYNLSGVLKKDTRYDFYVMWLEYEGICSYEHEIVEVMELLGLTKKEDLYKKIA